MHSSYLSKTFKMKIIYCWVGRGGRLAAARLLYIEGQVLMADYYGTTNNTGEGEGGEGQTMGHTPGPPPELTRARVEARQQDRERKRQRHSGTERDAPRPRGVGGQQAR